MKMSFWFGTTIDDFLFSGLNLTNALSMVGACFFFFLFTILSEGLKVLETKLRRDHGMRVRREMEGACAVDRSNLLQDNNSNSPGPSNRPSQTPQILPTYNKCVLKTCYVVLYTINTSVKYIIMLVVMLYNAYLFIAVVLGITIGYFVLSRIRVEYSIQSIQDKKEVVTVCEPGCEEPDGSTPPVLRGLGTGAYTCETRGQMEKLLGEGSPSHSSDGQSQDTAETTSHDPIEDEQSRKKSADGSGVKKSKKDDKTVSCCNKTDALKSEQVASCCGTSGEPRTGEFKSCSEQTKEH